MNHITYQKRSIICILSSINIVLCVLATIYTKYWYSFIWILALSSGLNSINILLILAYKSCKFSNTIKGNCSNAHTISIQQPSQLQPLITQHIAYIIPCYNETASEMNSTIKSLLCQKYIADIYKTLIIVCDGKLAKKNEPCTDYTLIHNILKPYINFKKSYNIADAYKCWNGTLCDLEVYTGFIHFRLNLILIVKPINIGKRDSIVLVRRLIYNYNCQLQDQLQDQLCDNDQVNDQDNDHNKVQNQQHNQLHNIISVELINIFNNGLINFNIMLTPVKIDYLIGTDADTIFADNCSYELIKSIEKLNCGANMEDGSVSNNSTIGIVGYVDIAFNPGQVNKWNLLTMYQYAEYTIAQYIKRQMQSVITHKVSCLSGCVQLLCICEETCGELLMQKFNRLPEPTDNIFDHIRSYASEDRNHVSHIFALNPKMQSYQCLTAIAYTHTPVTILGFLRQRKRWCAGASSNDMLLTMNSKHNKWERINTFISVGSFALTPFIFVATIEFIIALVGLILNESSASSALLMLYLSIIMLIPITYATVVIPFLRGFSVWGAVYYMSCIFVYYICGSIINLSVYIYTFTYLDDLNWNMKKTDQTVYLTEIGESNRLIRPSSSRGSPETQLSPHKNALQTKIQRQITNYINSFKHEGLERHNLYDVTNDVDNVVNQITIPRDLQISTCELKQLVLCEIPILSGNRNVSISTKVRSWWESLLNWFGYSSGNIIIAENDTVQNNGVESNGMQNNNYISESDINGIDSRHKFVNMPNITEQNTSINEEDFVFWNCSDV
uniref:Chitin synthase n=1 Tax=viral metagenome TaxID=1070528 RepID=A0A6C0HMB4_9ZZZZ